MIMIQYRFGKVLVSKNTVIYYFHGREVGLPTGGMPQCREFGYILFPWS